MKRHFTLFLLLLVTLSLSAQRELIEDFTAVMNVTPTGAVELTETIRVRTDGKIVKRGITRAITRTPIEGHQGRFNYEVVSVRRDGREIEWFDKQEPRLHTFYLGSKNKKLSPGTYTYEFVYRSANQIYRADSVEEIRWHLIDTETKLAVDRASMTVNFPETWTITQANCLAGGEGSREQYCNQELRGNSVTFTAVRRLNPGDGMTVSAGVARGSFAYLESAPASPGINQLAQPSNSGGSTGGSRALPTPVAPPNPSTPFERNGTLYTLLFGFFAALIYGHQSWKRHGQDPVVRGNEYEFYPPEGLSPAAASYSQTAMLHGSAVTGSLTELTVKGYIDIAEESTSGFLGLGKTDYFTLRATDKRPRRGEVPDEQYELYDRLFAKGDLVELDGDYNKQLHRASEAHRKSLAKSLREFKRDGANYRHLWPLIGILVVTLALALFYVRHASGPGMAALVIFGVLCVPGCIFYAWLIRKPSREKVALLQKIRAFKDYLDLDKRERDDLYNAPEMTSEYYDRILPYAIALGAKNEWAADLQHDWRNTSERSRRRANYVILYGNDFSTRINSGFNSTSTQASSGGGGSSFSGGGGSVGGGGGGTGGF